MYLSLGTGKLCIIPKTTVPGCFCSFALKGTLQKVVCGCQVSWVLHVQTLLAIALYSKDYTTQNSIVVKIKKPLFKSFIQIRSLTGGMT